MDDPWQAEIDDEGDEEPTGGAGGNSLDPDELDAEDDDSDLWDDLGDDAA